MPFRKWGYFALLTGVAFAILSGVPAWSQTAATPTVSRQVVDQQNAAVAGAVVKLTDPSTNNSLTTQSNEYQMEV